MNYLHSLFQYRKENLMALNLYGKVWISYITEEKYCSVCIILAFIVNLQEFSSFMKTIFIFIFIFVNISVVQINIQLRYNQTCPMLC